jgi:RHS repeat-associated protein
MKNLLPAANKGIVMIVALLICSLYSKAQLTLSSANTTGNYTNNLSITLGAGFSTSGPFTATILPADCTGLTASPSQTQNYVITNIPRIAGFTNETQLGGQGTCALNQAIQYVDGLGRPVQTIQVMGSPSGYDMIQPQAYDSFGREITKYLPYTPSSGTPGSFRPNAVNGEQGGFYAGPPIGVKQNSNPYSQIAFDNSPLNRPVEQGAPGAAWQLGSGHTVKMVYTLNNATAFSSDPVNGRQVALYYVTINSNNTRAIVSNGYYPANGLTVTISEDENWVSGRAGTVEEYKDIDGQVILKRVYNLNAGVVQQLSTYYVYDDLGHLSFVLPPASGADGAGTIAANTLSNLCYQYQYDERGRQVGKKIPGKGWEYTVYNTMDQPIATQDSLQRASGQWIFNKYDAQGRSVISGIWNNGGTAVSRASLQSTLTGITTNLYEASVSTGNGYTNVAWPTSNVTATLHINYYDNYTNIPGLPAAYSAPAGADLATRGELTGSLTEVLNTTNMLWTTHYYDYWGRDMKDYAQHYLGGTLSNNNYDAVSTTYNFTNALTTVTRQHWNTTGTAYPVVTIANAYLYDHAGRKSKSWEQITNSNGTPTTKILLSQVFYNEVGQLMTKQLHSTDSTNFLQNIAYAYNERGWLLSSTAQLFQMQLQYNSVNNVSGITPVAQYNGNIASQSWGMGALPNTNSFLYTYDKLNRLTAGNNIISYSENNISYDLMGNITGLRRYIPGPTMIDQLGYNYNGNQLQSVTDTSGNNNGLVNGTTNYTYDGNGNMLSSSNSANTTQNKSFTYNLLNLPMVATVATGNATYTYDAGGSKLRKISVINGTTSVTDYISGIQYKNNSSAIDFIQTEEGKTVLNSAGTAYDYYYYLGDNLGNTRVTFHTLAGTADTLQRDDYYPFGLEINRFSSSPKNEYLYNKKELQEELTQYDYGARFYDPVIGRFTTIDPEAEDFQSLSTYNYGLNNPVIMIDPDGREAEDAYGDEQGKPKPKPKPIQLKEVTITATRTHKKQDDDNAHWYSHFVNTYIIGKPMPKLGSTPIIFFGFGEVPPESFEEPTLLPQISQTTIDEFLKAAESLDRNGLTQAGRALQKHGNRSVSAYPQVPQNPGSLNSTGLKIVEDILNSPNKTVVPNKYGGNDIIDNVSGRGVRMDSNGKIGLLEPQFRITPSFHVLE